MKRQIIIFFGLMAAASPALAETFRCDIKEKHYCTAREVCKSINPTIYNRIDFSQETYSRCDKAGCDTYKASFSRSGIYIIIDVPGRGLFAKLSVDGSEFLEVATLLTKTYVSFGSCRGEK
jgi:hypothetical protein